MRRGTAAEIETVGKRNTVLPYAALMKRGLTTTLALPACGSPVHVVAENANSANSTRTHMEVFC